jgi:hypothetical protein
MFDWAKFRLTKGAVKLHLLLDHDGFTECWRSVKFHSGEACCGMK